MTKHILGSSVELTITNTCQNPTPSNGLLKIGWDNYRVRGSWMCQAIDVSLDRRRASAANKSAWREGGPPKAGCHPSRVHRRPLRRSLGHPRHFARPMGALRHLCFGSTDVSLKQADLWVLKFIAVELSWVPVDDLLGPICGPPLPQLA